MSTESPIDSKEQLAALQRRVVELEHRNCALEKLAATDELTGLFNRRALQARLSEEIARCKRYNRCVSLLFIDPDNFKLVNDSGGHAAGDAMLRRVATVMREACRETDIAARWGGDEFAMVLPDTTAPGAAGAAERIRECIAATQPGNEPATVSIGVASYSEEISSAEQLTRLADEQLYRAKRAGGNRVCGPQL